MLPYGCVTFHTFRYNLTTHLLEDRHEIRTVQELLGDHAVRTTTIYSRVIQHHLARIYSPLDRLESRPAEYPLSRSR